MRYLKFTIFIFFIFLSFGNKTFGQEFLPPIPAVQNLAQELNTINSYLGTNPPKHVAKYQKSIILKRHILIVIEKVKSGVSLESAFNSTVKSNIDSKLTSDFITYEGAYFTANSTWMRDELLPLVTK